jgi:hypothetical protein
MMKRALSLLFLLGALIAYAQQSSVDPYDGALKGKTYHSDFFAFSFTTPSGEDLQLKKSKDWRHRLQLLVSSAAGQIANLAEVPMVRVDDGKGHSLMAVQLPESFTVSARPLGAASLQTFTDRLAVEARRNPKATVDVGVATYDSRQFSRIDSFEMDSKGKHKENLNSVFLTEMNGYVLQFWAHGADEKKLARALKNMETLQFTPIAPTQ